jgi:PAS domain S-box-containing protein
LDRPVEPVELNASVLDAVERAGLGLTIIRISGAGLSRIYSNRQYCALTGYSADELRALKVPGLVPPSEMGKMAELQRVFHSEGRYPELIETAIVARDGTTIPVEVSMATVADGDGWLTYSFVRDIRERQRAALALRESEQRFRILAEASVDSITVISDGRFVYANPAAAAVLGFDTPEELMARPLGLLLVDPEEMRDMGERIARIMRGERLPPREYRGRKKDGSVAVMEISTAAMTYDGRPATLSFGRDTSERRAWQAELMRNDRLAAIGLLAASVAHEVNNPLTYMLLHLERLEELLPAAIADAALRQRTTEVIAAARDGGERVRTIVRDLLSVARHDHEATLISVGEVMDTALKLAGSAVGERAEIVHTTEDVSPVMANPGRLSQVFVNLLLNAADAFEQPAPTNRIEIAITSASTPGYVVIAIEDNGRGIAEPDLARIFEPLFTTKPRGSGTGLGLSICKGIVSDLGGSISAASRHGQGTRMEVRLPVAVRPAPVEPSPPGVAAMTRRRVVVIDDDVLVARSLGALLAAHHDVDTYVFPREALAALAEGELADHVLCDINMPGLSGPDLYEQLCARRPEYARRFTLITGGAASPRVDELVDSGAVRLLHKPCDAATILAAVVDGA